MILLGFPRIAHRLGRDILEAALVIGAAELGVEAMRAVTGATKKSSRTNGKTGYVSNSPGF